MATLRQIQRRIRSIQSTAKTTRAMSLVAGSKMRRAQQVALANRAYADQLLYLLADVVKSLEQTLETEGYGINPLLERREIKNPGLLLLTPDRGLCGGLNTALLRQATNFIVARPNTKLIAVGRKGGDFFRRTQANVIGSFTRLGDYPTYTDVSPISRLAMDSYASGEIDSLTIIYPRFINTVVQRPEQQELLPAVPPEGDDSGKVEYIYEPDRIAVLSQLMPRYVEVEVYRAVLELAASEQSARMVAMRNATDAAQEMIQELTLVRNKVRQEQITKELLDITGGVEAMNAS
jgi:F-type H+-transporting ATPase subunit gamma